MSALELIEARSAAVAYWMKPSRVASATSAPMIWENSSTGRPRRLKASSVVWYGPY